jgi:hypothetical protein
MSTLSQFAPFAGGGLKSFQTGYINVAAASASLGSGEDAGYVDVSVSSVNTAKAITSFEGSWGSRGTQQLVTPTDVNAQTVFATTRMVSATAVRVSSRISPASYGGPGVAGRWKIAEAN